MKPQLNDAEAERMLEDGEYIWSDTHKGYVRARRKGQFADYRKTEPDVIIVEELSDNGLTVPHAVPKEGREVFEWLARGSNKVVEIASLTGLDHCRSAPPHRLTAQTTLAVRGRSTDVSGNAKNVSEARGAKNGNGEEDALRARESVIRSRRGQWVTGILSSLRRSRSWRMAPIAR